MRKGGEGMGEWKCQKCGYTETSDKPPEECPTCKDKCEFVDVTCYIPDCGQTGSDPRLG
jgi:rubrerythrin